MKSCYLGLIVFLVGCAPRHAVYYPAKSTAYHVVNVTRPREEVNGLRYQEHIKAYPIGRYRDPRNPRIMHERHLTYRVEQDSTWDYSPNQVFNIPLGKVDAVSKPNSASSLKSAAQEVEVQKQQDEKSALVEQNKILASKLKKYEQDAQQIDQLSEHNQKLQTQLNQLQDETQSLKLSLEEKSKNPVVIEQPPKKGFFEKIKSFAGLTGENKNQ